MGLDFTRLNSLATGENPEEAEKKRLKKGLAETLLCTPESSYSKETYNAPEGNNEGLEGIAVLQRKAEAILTEKEQALAVYREYQENHKRAGELQREIADGTTQGADIYSLFLKAVEAISLMTSDKMFYTQTEKNLKTVYGIGLGERVPLELELEEVENRLAKLRQARETATEPAENLRRIDRAIQAHEERARQLRDLQQ